MAEKAIFGQFLTCHVCEETFSDPVSLSCNHNFCSDCLTKFWEEAKNKNCPICKRKSSKENLVVNSGLKELADVFAGRQKPGSSETREKNPPEMCSKHPEERLLFCTDEERAVCSVCEVSLHQSHKVVHLEEAVSEQLTSDLTSPQDKKKYEHLEEMYENMIQFSKKQLASTEKQISAEFNKLHQFLREEEESRLAALREEERQKRETITNESKMIEEQIDFLWDCKFDIFEPTVEFVQSYEDIQSRIEAQRSQPDPQVRSGMLIDVAKHLGNLSFRVWEKMKEVVFFSPVILDPNTANHSLYLCEDLTSMRCGDTEQKLPDNLERFTKYATVLASEGFTSGSHSWVVEVGDHPDWTVGLATESVDRKGEMFATPGDGVWCLSHRSGKYMNGVGGTLRLEKSVQRVRVQLDYDRGDVSFYDHHDSAHIYTHKDTFTEKLFPFFTVGRAGDATNADVKILSSDISE